MRCYTCHKILPAHTPEHAEVIAKLDRELAEAMKASGIGHLVEATMKAMR